MTNNLSLIDLLSIDESLDNTYDWKADDTKLPFYVYQQYTFEVGSITYAVRFMRAALALGIKARHISYVVVGKKLNKKVSNKIVGIGNVRKFISTVYAIIKHHLETAPKANRGVAIRFDAPFFDKMEKLLGMILRLKLKQEYKFSDDFTWSPIEDSKNFYVWKKQFSFKTLFKEFLVAQEKGTEGALVTSDLATDTEATPETDVEEVPTSAPSNWKPVFKLKISKNDGVVVEPVDKYVDTIDTANKAITPNDIVPTVDSLKKPWQDYWNKIRPSPDTYLQIPDTGEIILFFINTVRETGSCIHFDQAKTTSSILMNGVDLESLMKGYEEFIKRGAEHFDYLPGGGRTYVVTDAENGGGGFSIWAKNVSSDSEDPFANIHFGDMDFTLNRTVDDIYGSIENDSILLRTKKEIEFYEQISFPLQRRVASVSVATKSNNFLIFKVDGALEAKGYYITDRNLLSNFKSENGINYYFVSFDKKPDNFIWRYIQEKKVKEYTSETTKIEHKEEIEITKPVRLSDLSTRVYDKDVAFAKRKSPTSKYISIGPFEFSLNSDLAKIAEKLERIKKYKETLIDDNHGLYGFYSEVHRELNSMFGLHPEDIREFNKECSKINKGFFSDDTESALKAYTGSSYEWINKVLRGKKAFDELGVYAKETLINLNKAFREDAVRVPALKDYVIFRGQSVAKDEMHEIIQTKRYICNGFISTSANIRTAYAFLKHGGQLFTAGEELTSLQERGRVANMMAITGLHKIPVIFPGFKSNHDSESEIVLPRGTMFELMNHHIVKSTNNVELFVTTYNIIGVGGELSYINERKVRSLMEMVEDKKISPELAKQVLVIDSLVDLLDKDEYTKKTKEGYTDQEWADAVVKWTTD